MSLFSQLGLFSALLFSSTAAATEPEETDLIDAPEIHFGTGLFGFEGYLLPARPSIGFRYIGRERTTYELRTFAWAWRTAGFGPDQEMQSNLEDITDQEIIDIWPELSKLLFFGAQHDLLTQPLPLFVRAGIGTSTDQAIGMYDILYNNYYISPNATTFRRAGLFAAGGTRLSATSWLHSSHALLLSHQRSVWTSGGAIQFNGGYLEDLEDSLNEKLSPRDFGGHRTLVFLDNTAALTKFEVSLAPGVALVHPSNVSILFADAYDYDTPEVEVDFHILATAGVRLGGPRSLRTTSGPPQRTETASLPPESNTSATLSPSEAEFSRSVEADGKTSETNSSLDREGLEISHTVESDGKTTTTDGRIDKEGLSINHAVATETEDEKSLSDSSLGVGTSGLGITSTQETIERVVDPPDSVMLKTVSGQLIILTGMVGGGGVSANIGSRYLNPIGTTFPGEEGGRRHCLDVAATGGISAFFMNGASLSGMLNFSVSYTCLKLKPMKFDDIDLQNKKQKRSGWGAGLGIGGGLSISGLGVSAFPMPKIGIDLPTYNPGTATFSSRTITIFIIPMGGITMWSAGYTSTF